MRQFAAVGVTGVLAWAGIVVPTAILAGSQEVTKASKAAKRSTAAPVSAIPRMPDGRPDLQGVWSFHTLTPFERPAEFADKEFLTEKDVARIETEAAAKAANASTKPIPAELEGISPGGTLTVFTDDPGKIVKSRRTSLIVDPPTGRLPPVTPEAEKRAEQRALAMRRAPRGPEDRPIWERCLVGYNSGPPMIPNSYNETMQLFQTADSVAILNEMIHNVRWIPLDGRPQTTLRQWTGTSRGHWEGDTLVVESTNFRPEGTGTMTLSGVFMELPIADENLRLIERFTRTGADTLVYRFTVDDPTVWTQPWTAEIPMTTSSGLYEYACHEGNYGLANIFATGSEDEMAKRVQEKAAARRAQEKTQEKK